MPQKEINPPQVRLVECKTILGESGICDYAVNCYTGCTHGCAYCYARFMGRFHRPGRSWGSFVDVKTNAPAVLARQLGKSLFAARGSVFLSSVCDAYQPIEEQYGLTRRCLQLLLEAGMEVHVQTKSALVRRDFDLIERSRSASVCLTVTTLDDAITAWLEPGAPRPAERLDALREARRRGITAKCFVGPLIPGLTDGLEPLTGLLRTLAELDICEIYVDRLNPRWGVWRAMQQALRPYAAHCLPLIGEIFSEQSRSRAYNRQLRETITAAARSAGVADRLRMLV